ncbi:MAG: hypothetical protein ACKN9U_25450 [Pirellulaceae bacterium]
MVNRKSPSNTLQPIRRDTWAPPAAGAIPSGQMEMVILKWLDLYWSADGRKSE